MQKVPLNTHADISSQGGGLKFDHSLHLYPHFTHFIAKNLNTISGEKNLVAKLNVIYIYHTG